MCTTPPRTAQVGDGSDGDHSARLAGVARGPGTAPLELEEKAPRLTSNIIDVLPRQDGPAHEVGQMIGRSARAPRLFAGDESNDGGGSATRGDGGEAVWNSDLLPREREVVEQFFR